MTEQPGWWLRSSSAPDLTPVFGHGVGEGLRLNSAAAAASIRFPWWDSPYPAREFVEWLLAAADGETFCDLDQGWRIDAIRCGEHLHFRASDDVEDGEVLAILSVSQAVFCERLRAAWAVHAKS